MLDEARVLSALAMRDIAPDDRQRGAIASLVAMLGAPLRRGWFGRVQAPPGVYCHGLPGRGKSLVVDTVFSLATCTKRRIHFHEFLRDMNRRLVNEPKGPDRLASVSRQWLSGIELLCFDEFHVHDIADAFLVGRFLEVAIELGTRIVLTSNYAPQDLLPDPLFHERFRPTIEAIEHHFTIIHFDGTRDYRRGGAHAAQGRFFAPVAAAAGQLRMLFVRYEGQAALSPQAVTIAGRPLAVLGAGKVMIWTDFDNLCVESRSHLDYLELAERWHALIVDHLHADRLSKPDTVQRLIWLVDIFYDRKRALFIASDQPIGSMLDGLSGAHDLSRTTSRLAEMQARTYADTFNDIPLPPTEVATCQS